MKPVSKETSVCVRVCVVARVSSYSLCLTSPPGHSEAHLSMRTTAPVNSCPSSSDQLCHCTIFYNRINNQEDGAQNFQYFNTGTGNGVQGSESLAVSEPQ